MRHQYDVSSKWLIQHHADAILRLAGVGSISSWRALPGELVQSRQLPDGLVEARLPGHDKPVLFLLEINTYPDNRVPEALLDDILLTYLNRGQVPEVVTILLHPKGNVHVDDSIRLSSPLGWSHLQADWKVVELWSLRVTDVLPIEDPGLAPWLPLMRIDGPAEAILQQCRDVIDRKTEGSEKANLLAICQFLGGLRYHTNLLSAIFGGERAMIESPVLQEWFKKRDLQVWQAAIVDNLEVRFGSVPEELSAAVRALADVPRLQELHRVACSVSSLDDFRAELRK